MAVNSGEEDYDAYSVVVLPDEGTAGPQYEQQSAFLSPVEATTPLKTQLFLDTQLNNQNYINLAMENTVSYSSCILDVDIEKGKSETARSNDESAGNLKNEDPALKLLQKQVSFEMGEKYMQLLMNHSLVLPKFTTRDKSAAGRVLDGPNNRLRKFKRSASFNSRKVVLLFSIIYGSWIRQGYGYQNYESSSLRDLFARETYGVNYGDTDIDLLDSESEAD